MNEIVQFQMLHFQWSWLNPYYIFQVIVDMDLLKAFWTANGIPILISLLLVLSLFWLFNKALKTAETEKQYKYSWVCIDGVWVKRKTRRKRA